MVVFLSLYLGTYRFSLALDLALALALAFAFGYSLLVLRFVLVLNTKIRKCSKFCRDQRLTD